MKVVLFCGGYGMRMHNNANGVMPKPMQMVGPRPLIWDVMRYYAHFGHKEFILCLGYGAPHIKNYFLTYQESASNDFVMRGSQVELMHSDVSEWSITFVDTGLESAIGERLRRVRHHLAGDDHFLANYADVLTNAPLDHMIAEFRKSGAAASMLIVPPQSTFHCVQIAETGEVKGITPVSDLSIWENGGYFVLSQEVFDVLPPGGDLRRRLRHAGAAQQAVRLPIRRVLEAGRHLQGTRRTRSQISRWRSPMDALGTRQRRVGGCYGWAPMTGGASLSMNIACERR